MESGTTDNWVNDAIGRPFFVVSKTVSDGLSKTLLEEIVPQLLATVPGQPSREELDADRALLRQLFLSSADLIPDEAAKSLTVRIHRMANHAHDQAVASLLETLNAADFTHPETGHAIRYIMT